MQVPEFYTGLWEEAKKTGLNPGELNFAERNFGVVYTRDGQGRVKLYFQVFAGAQPNPPNAMDKDDQDALLEDRQTNYSQANATCNAIRLELDALEREGDADTGLALERLK